MDSIVMKVGNSPNPILAFPEITCLDFEETMFIDSQSSPPPGITPLRWLMFVRNQGRRRFITFVHQILLHYKGEKISRFRLRFCFSTEHFDHVNRWIEFAITKQAQELDLDFSGSGLAQDSRTGYCPYELPHYVFSCSSCNVLKLNFCKFHPSVFRIFSSLKMLTLKRLELSSELVSQVLNNCLVLEILHLEMCHGLCHLKILSSNLRLEKLTIRDCRPLTQGIEICSPNLKSLSYFGGVVLFRLEKMLSLHEVVLDFGLQTVLHESDHHKFIGNLLTDLDHAAVMSVCTYLIQVLSLKGRSLPNPLYNLRHLTLNTMLDNQELQGIAFLLRNSPQLHSLSIELGLGRAIKGSSALYLDMSLVGEDFWESRKQPFDCISYQLKFVEINWFAAEENEIHLVRYIIKNATALEKMIINLCQQSTSDERNSMILRLAREISGSKKASPNAKIIIQ